MPMRVTAALLVLVSALALQVTGALAQDVAPPGQGRHAKPLGSPSVDASSYWRDAWRGWHFYEEPANEELPAPRLPHSKPPTPLAVQPAQRAPELVEFERLQKSLEEYRHIAIMRPTEGNVRRYMELEAKVVARASYFADVAQRVAWATPSLDPSQQGRPLNAKALEVFEQQQMANRSKTVAGLGRNHVLFLFFRADCPYCHAFAPTLEAFQARHGIQVVAISLDGGPLPGFPAARRDNGIAKALQVTQVPAVFLAQPFTGKITPIGFGVLSESQLLERISIVSSPDGEAMLPGAVQRLALP